MKIAIIGGGNVGGTLARRFASAGHELKVGVPDPGSDKYSGLIAVSPAEAAAHGELVFLATPWGVTEDTVRSLAGVFADKVVVDCTNPIAANFSGLVTARGDSGAQRVAALAPGAKVVKAFNTIGFNIMADPDFNGTPATLLMASDDSGAKLTVASLAKEIGFEPLDAGPLERAAELEAVAWLWITLSIRDGRDFTFVRVVR